MTELRRQQIRADDSPSIDAFSRWRVSNPEGIFDSTFHYDLQPLLYEAVVTGAGAVAHSFNNASAQLSVSGAGDVAVLQSRAYHHYIPAKSQMIAMSQVPGTPDGTVVKEWGYFDDDDGIFFRDNAGTLEAVRRSSVSGAPVDVAVAQANWNLDKLNGTGPSTLTLDVTKATISRIDLQWLGMGRVRMGFDIDGLVVYCHEFLTANVLTVPYMRTASLPVRWRIETSSAAGSMLATSASVISEGGTELDRGFPFSTGTVAAITAGAEVAIMGIRPLLLYKTHTNRIQIVPRDFGGLVTGTNEVIWRIRYGATLTGGAWAAVDGESAAEANITPTGFSGGIEVDRFLVPATAQAKGEASKDFASRLPITLDAAGANPIELILTAQAVAATSACYGRIGWEELK